MTASPHNQQVQAAQEVRGESGAGWWKRNRLALIALAALVPLTAFVFVGDSVRRSRQNSLTEPITVESGHTTNYGGATIGPATARFVTAGGSPPGSRVVELTVPIANGTNLYCRTVTLRETTGPKREWQPSSLLLAPVGPSQSDVCRTYEPGPYELFVWFVVPADAGSFVVDLYADDLLPEVVVLELDVAANS